MTRPLAVLVALLSVALLPAAAGAQQGGSIVSEAASALRTTPVYVHPDAEEAITPQEDDRLERMIADTGAGPLYVAIVPDAARNQAGGSTEGVARAIANELRQPGTYAIIAGDEFRAGSTIVEDAGRMANDAIEIRGDEGAFAILQEFVERVGAARKNGGEPPSEGVGDGGWGGLALLGVLGGGAVLFGVSRSRRRRREQEEQVGELRETVREDLAALGEDIRALDIDIEMPDVEPAAREDYGKAVDRYDAAERALDRSRSPEDFGPIAEALEEGRWAMASAKARLEHRAPPERRPPCFFDPRHGPSTRDVEWAPDGYAARAVPVCEADAVRIESGEEPMTREIMTGGRRVPLYDAPGFYGPYAGGFFGGFTGFLPGLLFGSLLGSAFGGFGASDASAAGFGGGDAGGGGFGDFGGGDFGGGGFGDFGGGDF